MGIRPEWIAVADQIGFENFVTAWNTLARFPLDERNRITVPTLSTYHNYQRNQAIRTLAASGKDPQGICEEMRQSHNIALSVDVVKRALRRMAS